MKTIKVTASSGVSLIGVQDQSMLGWIQYIIDRGEVPTVEILTDDAVEVRKVA